MRPAILWLVFALSVAMVACRKPKPSPEYLEASGKYTTLLAQLGDDAFSDPEMTHIEDLLARVPASSSDAASANQLKATIAAERKRVLDEAAAHEKLLNSLTVVDALPSSPSGASPPPVAAAETGPADAGSAPAIAPGMSLDELVRNTNGCFGRTGPVRLKNPDQTEASGELYERTDSGLCRDRFPSQAGKVLVFKDGKLLGEFAKTALRTEVLPGPSTATPPYGAGGAAGTGGTGGAAGAAAPPAPVQPNVTPAPAQNELPKPPTSPGENTGPAPQ